MNKGKKKINLEGPLFFRVCNYYWIDRRFYRAPDL